MNLPDIDTWAAIAALVGVPLAIWTIVAPRFDRGNRLKEAILTALPNGRDLPPFDYENDDKNHYLQRHGTSLAELSAAHFAEDKKVFGALCSLVKSGKVEGGVIQWDIDEGPPELIGKTAVMPLFFKRGISPSLRSSPEDLIKFIK